MQEEIEQKSFNIMISTTKLSARTVLRAVKAAFRLYQSKASQNLVLADVLKPRIQRLFGTFGLLYLYNECCLSNSL